MLYIAFANRHKRHIKIIVKSALAHKMVDCMQQALKTEPRKHMGFNVHQVYLIVGRCVNKLSK